MNETISRRNAMALAAALAATVVTAVAAVGGLARWNAQPQSATPPAALVQQAAAPQHWEGSD